MAETRRTYDELHEIYQMMLEYYPDQLRAVFGAMAEENICKCTPIEVCDECHFICEAWKEEE